jgi:hypothetical protein
MYGTFKIDLILCQGHPDEREKKSPRVYVIFKKSFELGCFVFRHKVVFGQGRILNHAQPNSALNS